MKIRLNPVGSIEIEDGRSYVAIDEAYRPALKELEGFSHLDILWWAHLADAADHRDTLVAQSPYRNAPETVGIFATRSPVRPNPVMLSVAAVLSIDAVKGIIKLPWIDAEAGSPVIDIKPYHPCADRVRDARVPSWCATWPQWYEDSGSFDWSTVFNF